MSFFLCVFCVSECVYRDKKRRYSTRLIKRCRHKNSEIEKRKTERKTTHKKTKRAALINKTHKREKTNMRKEEEVRESVQTL